MTSESKFGVFHNILAKSLEEWFNKKLSSQLMSANGTITSPAGTVTPFVATGLKPDIIKLRFNQYKIKNCGRKNGNEFFQKLFEYIGSELAKQLKRWSTNPVSSKTPNPINIFGIAETPMVTTHFKYYGMKCRIEMSSKEPDCENITKDLWDTFEKYLKSAINKIPVMLINVSGSTPGGVFNGVAQIKMKV
jgi:hypothetical protein